MNLSFLLSTLTNLEICYFKSIYQNVEAKNSLKNRLIHSLPFKNFLPVLFIFLILFFISALLKYNGHIKV